MTSVQYVHSPCRILHLAYLCKSFLIDKTIVIIAVSTAGQGDVPANARKFWKSLLRKKLPPDFLKNVQFTSFGLGDSSYPKYCPFVRSNHTVRFINMSQIQLGRSKAA